METESSLKDWEFSPHAYKTTADSKEHKCFDVDGMLMTFNTEANQKCRNIAQRNTNRNFKKNNNDICTIINETEKYKKIHTQMCINAQTPIYVYITYI